MGSFLKTFFHHLQGASKHANLRYVSCFSWWLLSINIVYLCLFVYLFLLCILKKLMFIIYYPCFLHYMSSTILTAAPKCTTHTESLFHFFTSKFVFIHKYNLGLKWKDVNFLTFFGNSNQFLAQILASFWILYLLKQLLN